LFQGTTHARMLSSCEIPFSTSSDNVEKKPFSKKLFFEKNKLRFESTFPRREYAFLYLKKLRFFKIRKQRYL